MFEVEIYISLKKTVADPQGLTVKHAIESLGYQGINDLRMGKLVRLQLNLKDKKYAENKVNEMCKKLLVNPIIEEYSFQIKEI
ncbi:MAG: phosphoribosylformylglycinamidine synthase subunit PurS [Candidatus Omnitrophota bacterium]